MNKNLSSILMFITNCFLGKEYVSKMNVKIKGGIPAFSVNITHVPTSGKAIKKPPQKTAVFWGSNTGWLCKKVMVAKSEKGIKHTSDCIESH